MPRQSSDDSDDSDHTDELPVLLETVAVDDPIASAAPEDTGQHTVVYQTVRAEERSQSAALRTDLAVRAAKIDELEAEIARLADRCRELEEQLGPKEASIRDLGRSLATLRQTAEAGAATERQLAAQLADREARMAQQVADDKRLRKELAARTTEIDELKAGAAAAATAAARLEERLATREPASDDSGVQQLLEDNAALTNYIAGRRQWWDQLETGRTALAARVAALEHELASNVARRKRAEALATKETARATSLRAELVVQARRLENAERELGLARRRADEPPPQPATAQAAPELAVPVVVPIAPRAADGAPTAGAAAPEPPGESAFEVIAQLEGQVEFKRQQVAAQLVELHDREQRLRTATAELERLRGELATLRTDFDRSKADVARLERAVLDKDRALEARDARIATLQDEINQRLGAQPKLAAAAPSSPSAEPKRPDRPRAVEPHVEGVPAPALICLTGEAPKRFALSKKEVTVGRAAHCDLQVMTHFVSREHARISLSGDKVLIEDLGSRNGVFVNSVRVDRHELHHGDLITIGETQFRFVESMAH